MTSVEIHLANEHHRAQAIAECGVAAYDLAIASGRKRDVDLFLRKGYAVLERNDACLQREIDRAKDWVNTDRHNAYRACVVEFVDNLTPLVLRQAVTNNLLLAGLLGYKTDVPHIRRLFPQADISLDLETATWDDDVTVCSDGYIVNRWIEQLTKPNIPNLRVHFTDREPSIEQLTQP